MHMADALVSPSVAGVGSVLSAVLFVVAAKKVKKMTSDYIVPLMGVMGAFIFTAQMINFSIPGTGSSGHIVGGVLLSTVLGPWAAYITLVSVLVVQCLLFADGGLLALGCNVLNMAAMTCLVAYPLIFGTMMKLSASFGRILWISILTCVLGLELGAFAVTIETEFSGITALPIGQFLLFMLPIHLAIGICEGVATASVVYFMQKYKPELLAEQRLAIDNKTARPRWGKAMLVFAVVSFILGSAFRWIASSDPDGMEWSIARLTGGEDVVEATTTTHMASQNFLQSTAVIPDYELSTSGIIGGVLVVLFTWVIIGLLRLRKKT